MKPAWQQRVHREAGPGGSAQPRSVLSGKLLSLSGPLCLLYDNSPCSSIAWQDDSSLRLM